MSNRAIVLAICVILAVEISAEETRVMNAQGKYAATFPTNWIIWGPDSLGAVGATTYPKDSAAGGGIVPPGEASITIYTDAKGTATLDQWIAQSLRFTEEVRRATIAPRKSGAAIKSYIEIEARDDVAPGIYYRTVTDYFKRGNRLFAIRLEYKEGDPRASEYRAALGSVVNTFSPY
ncbi:MAG: hypothetical protein ABL995_20845 [Bryobacteraceae bacterium]